MTEPLEPVPVIVARRRRRTVVVWTLLALAGVLFLLATFAVWVNRVALNTDGFTDASAQLLEDPAIRAAVATRAVDELFDSVDVQAEVEDQLPSDLKSLSGPATAGLREASYRLVERALEQGTLQRLWARSIRESHRTLVAVLEDRVPAFTTESGVVTLDLEQIVLETADRIGIRSRIEGRLPENVGRVEILRSDELDAAQDGFRILRTLAWILPVLALAGFALAVWLAPDRRRAVRGVGITLLVVGLAGLLAANIVGHYLVTSLTTSAETKTAAANAWHILTELLRASYRWSAAVGILFIAAAWLAGPGRRALAVRRTIAPALRERVWAYALLGGLAVLLLVARPVGDFVRLLFLVVLLALGAVWIELTRRQTLLELPAAAGAGLLGDARGRVGAWWTTQRATWSQRGPRRPSPQPAPAQPPADLTAQLAQLADLHARGELTDDEYAAAKARVLEQG